jgi:hypothetical protein
LKKLLALMLMISLTLLCGCSGKGGAEDKAIEIRSKYLDCADFSLRAEMTADYGDRVYDYVVAYTGDGETGVLDIEKPLEVEGISVVYEDDGPRLMYAGAMLDTGPLWADGASPAKAFPMLIDAWRRGWISAAYSETVAGRNCVVLDICSGSDEERLVRTWFYEDTLEPAAAELFSDGVSVLRCTFE